MSVGADVGLSVGAGVGLFVGDGVGFSVGADVGLSDGDFVGACDGAFDGDLVGKSVGEGAAQIEKNKQTHKQYMQTIKISIIIDTETNTCTVCI